MNLFFFWLFDVKCPCLISVSICYSRYFLVLDGAVLTTPPRDTIRLPLKVKRRVVCWHTRLSGIRPPHYGKHDPRHLSGWPPSSPQNTSELWHRISPPRALRLLKHTHTYLFFDGVYSGGWNLHPPWNITRPVRSRLSYTSRVRNLVKGWTGKRSAVGTTGESVWVKAKAPFKKKLSNVTN